MTRVVIESKFQNDKTSYEQSNKISKNTEMISSQKEWVSCFQVTFDDNQRFLCDKISQKCNYLTSVELTGSCNQIDIDLSSQDTILNGKFLAYIKPIKSPMQDFSKVKDSNTIQLKKFLQTIDSSYQNAFYSIHDNHNEQTYALLNVKNVDRRDLFNSNTRPKLKISQFLRQHLKLFEHNIKVSVRVQSIDLPFIQDSLSSSTKRIIKLKTNYSKNVSLKTPYLCLFYVS